MDSKRSRRQFLKQSAGMAAFAAGASAIGVGALGDEPAAGWKAGIARSVITPEKAVWLAGYGSKRPPDGKLHDLWMKSLALEDADGRRAVLITSDFQGVPKGMSDNVFEQLQEQFGLAREQVMFTFSHNHCGPRLGDDLVDYYPIEQEQVELVKEYTSLMEVQAVAMVGESLANLAPADLAIGEGQATFAVNRRNNREADIYTDDMIAYIPSRRVWEEGGYEGGSNLYEYGRPALRWSGDIEDRIATSVHKLLTQPRRRQTCCRRFEGRPGTSRQVSIRHACRRISSTCFQSLE